MGGVKGLKVQRERGFGKDNKCEGRGGACIPCEQGRAEKTGDGHQRRDNPSPWEASPNISRRTVPGRSQWPAGCQTPSKVGAQQEYRSVGVPSKDLVKHSCGVSGTSR